MHPLIVGLGVVVVLILVVHIFFRIVKFTLSVALLGIGLVVVVYVFQVYMGIDLVQVIAKHI